MGLLKLYINYLLSKLTVFLTTLVESLGTEKALNSRA
jgi:hypothetical protein